MAFLSRTSSPVLVMAPQPLHQPSPFTSPLFAPQPAPSSRRSARFADAARRLPSRVAGRKRSRDEAAVNLDEPIKLAQAPIQLAQMPIEQQANGAWSINGSGVLPAAGSGYFGTAADDPPSGARPRLHSNKSQRLDLSVALAAAAAATAQSTAGGPDPISPSSQQPPVVDDFTVHLGIGWRRLSGDTHIQAAARGWAKYIENHYPLSNPLIRLESKGLESFLVEADQGFFLFADSLHQGRLISRSAPRVLDNLRVAPPVFDSDEVMTPSSTPAQTSGIGATAYFCSEVQSDAMDVEMK